MTSLEKTGISDLTSSNRAKISRHIEPFFPVLLVIVLSAAMLYFTNLIPAIGKWYSYDPSFRLQTEAFLSGELAIQPVPYRQEYDASWGNGIQLVWGLGVPLIRFPFEVIAKGFGFFGFPERVVFLFFYAMVSVVLWKSLDTTGTPDFHPQKGLVKKIQNIPILFFAMLSPALITMIHAKFAPFEEVVAYGYLWAFLLFALLHIFMNNNKSYIYLLICLLAGFSPNIRPTIGAYGFLTFLLAFYFAWNYKIKLRWLGLPLFMAGTIFLLATNHLRYGNPLEFGHRLLLMRAPLNDYLLKFENPMQWVSFTAAGLELLSALFFIDLDKDILLWSSYAPRMRELNFKPYDFLILSFLLLSWVVVAWVWLRDIRGAVSSVSGRDKIIKWGGLWSFFSFVMLFYFYSRTPALTSRYMVDFGPAIVVGIVMLYLSVNNLIRERVSDKLSFPLKVILSATFLGWTLVSLSSAKIAPIYQYLSDEERINVANAETASRNLAASKHTTGPPLPARYACGDTESKYGIPFNNFGWIISANCTVSLVTTHFLDNPKCLAIYIEPIGGIPDWVTRNYSDKEIEVKMGLKSLHRISDISWGYGKVIKYCSEEKSPDESRDYSKFELISIKWLNLQKHPNLSSPPLRLISLENIQ